MSTTLKTAFADPYLTSDEFAGIARIHPKHAARLRRQGRGPAYYQSATGGRVLYRASDVDAWMRLHTHRPCVRAETRELG